MKKTALYQPEVSHSQPFSELERFEKVGQTTCMIEPERHDWLYHAALLQCSILGFNGTCGFLENGMAQFKHY